MLKILLLILAFAVVSKANVIGLDFGTDTMKVAIVQPGQPLEIVNNFQSKRKTPTSISFYRNERLFGADSIAIMTRKPELTFSKTYRMLGRVADHPHVKELKEQYFPHVVETNSTTQFTTVQQESTQFTPEEFIAMIMQHAKDMTANYGGKIIKDAVITIPSHFTQHERRALETSAEIADLRVLTLIEENTAAALQYGIDRTYEEPTTVLFYNMGASSVQVSIAVYSAFIVKEGGKNKTVGQFEIVGKAWDSSLGGFNFDLKLAELLANRFNEKWSKKASGKGKDLKDFFRPMTRLRNEASKIKEVLSANVEFPVKTEQLHAETDLSTKVTRAEFEEAASDLFSRVLAPIDKALEMANLTLAEINHVELLGGGVRMPKVKKLLEDFFKKEGKELGQHLNGDEAMALGAAFRAANISTAFRVRKIGITDISSHGVSVRLAVLPKEAAAASSGFFGLLSGGKAAEAASDDDSWVKQTELFAAKSSIPSKVKKLSFPHDRDILCTVEYTDPAALPPGVSPVIAVYNITGVADFAKDTASKNLGLPKVQLSFLLDSSGMVTLTKAEATLDIPVKETVAEADAPDVEGQSAAPTEPEDGESAGEPQGEEAAAGADGESVADEKDKDGSAKKDSKDKDAKKDSKKSKKEKKEEKKAKKESNLLRSLAIVEDCGRVSPPCWSPAQILEAKNRLRALDAADEARRAKEAALNDLEAYIYKVKNRISEDEKELQKVSTEEQRDEVTTAANVVAEWLEDEGRDVDVATYKQKQSGLRKPAEAIFKRYAELTERPKAVALAQETIKNVTSEIAKWDKKLPQVTEKEKEQLLEAITKAEDWIEAKQEAQLRKKSHEEPAFESGDIPTQMRPIIGLFEKLVRKPKPPPEKVNVTTSSANTTSADNSTSSTNSTADGPDGEGAQKSDSESTEDLENQSDGEL